MNSPELSVVSYNTKEALADPERSDDVLRFVEGLQPAVGTLHSGYWTRPDADSPLREEASPVLERFVSRLSSLGYEVVCRDEGDTTSRPDKTGFVGFVRSELGTGSTLDAGTRQGYLATITDPETGKEHRIGGLHITDTDEASRLVQIAHLPDVDVLLADANAIYRGSRVARVLRLLRPLADRLPVVKNHDYNNAKGLDVIAAHAHTLQCLVWMADGRAMAALEAKGLHDADPAWQPTIHKFGVGIAQLDHILYKPESVSVKNYRVHRDVRASDHWPISAVIRTI